MLPYNDMLTMLPSADQKILKDYFANLRNYLAKKIIVTQYQPRAMSFVLA